MTPWVARQWHARGCSPWVFGDLCLIQRLRGHPLPLRFYAQSSVQTDARRRSRVSSAVIVPSSVAHTVRNILRIKTNADDGSVQMI